MAFPKAFYCQLHPFLQVGFYLPRIDIRGQFFQHPVVVVVGNAPIGLRPEPAPDVCQRFCHELSPIHLGFALYNGADFAQRSRNITTCLKVLIGRVGNEDVSSFVVSKSH